MKNKRIWSLLLACAMILSMVGCGNQAETSEPTETKQNVASNDVEVVEEKGITFPLEEEYTFDLMVKNTSGEVVEALEKTAFWQDLYEATNVKVNIIALPATDTMNALNGMFTAKKEGDAILSNFISDTELTLMAANNLLLPLNEYVENTDLMVNFNERVLADNPATKGVISNPEGNIIALPLYNADPGNYLESPMWINKTWLDQLGLEMPTTMDELEAVLTAFKENDMNGNGEADEIPYIVLNGNWQAHFEAFLGHFGVPTKDGNTEHYIYLDNGEVKFAPTSQNFKDAITLLNRWYENGLIWEECFTGTGETYSAKLLSEELMIGMYTGGTAPGNKYDDYVQLAPVSVDGYETRWYVHPGVMGVKGRFALTRSCDNPEIVMKWVDMFYSFENSLRAIYGEEADGRYKMEDGKAVIYNISDPVTLDKLKVETPTLKDAMGGGDLPTAFTSTDYAERFNLDESALKVKQDSLAVYKEYLNEEIWPRPYMSEDVVNRINELRTDIFNLVNQKRAEWITGVSDIDAEWDSYVARLEKMNVDEYVQILQGVYDSYLESQK